jgi:hypothetical protein
MDVAPYTTGVFVSVAREGLQTGVVPQDLRGVIDLATRSGVGVIRFDVDAALHPLKVEAPVLLTEAQATVEV